MQQRTERRMSSCQNFDLAQRELIRVKAAEERFRLVFEQGISFDNH